ncbi:MAG: 30S ribosomal protein S16 [Patescibacteria group bacterium]
MAVVIRLSRTGKKGERKFRIVVKEKRSRRDGDSIESLGWYEKGKNGGKKELNMERYNYWLSQGALPSPTVAKLAK